MSFHSLVGEGMEEGEFQEACEYRDYEKVGKVSKDLEEDEEGKEY